MLTEECFNSVVAVYNTGDFNEERGVTQNPRIEHTPGSS